VVVIGVVGEVVHGGSVAESHRSHDPEAFEFVEEPVDRRFRDIRMEALQRTGDVLDRRMIGLVVDECLQNRPPRGGGPASTRPDESQGGIDPAVVRTS
jgi:hypothetical protein